MFEGLPVKFVRIEQGGSGLDQGGSNGARRSKQVGIGFKSKP
jgi:hypothetical protein